MPPMATDVAASSSGNIGTGGQWSIDGLGSGSTDDGRPQDSRKQLMEGATIGMCATMFAFFLMRAYCRFRLLKMARVEDWLIIPGVIFAILQAIYIVLNAEAGGGEHIWNIKKENLLYLVRVRSRTTSRSIPLLPSSCAVGNTFNGVSIMLD